MRNKINMKKLKIKEFIYLLNEENRECGCCDVSDRRYKYKNHLIIPETITHNGITYTVTTIPNDSFRGSKITSISFPETIKKIGGFCFIGCDYLNNVDIPDTIKSIGFQSFCNCCNLSTIKLNDITEIYPKAFFNTPYYRNLFSNCKDNECIYLGNSLINIGDNCETVITRPGTRSISIPCRSSIRIKKLILSNTVSYIELTKFITIENIYVDSLESYFNINILTELRRLGLMINLYVNNKLVKDLIVPDYIRSLSRLHISGLSINTIKINDQLRRVDYNCFTGCKNLKSLTLPGLSPTFFNSEVLSESGIKEIIINQNCRFTSETLKTNLDIIIKIDRPINVGNRLFFENINNAFRHGIVKPDIILVLLDDSKKTIDSIISAFGKSDLKNLVIHLPEEMLSADYSDIEGKFFIDFRVPSKLLDEFKKVLPRSVKYSYINYKGCSDLEYYLDGDKTIIIPKLDENDENQYKGIIKIPNTLKNVELYPFAFANCIELKEVICNDDIKINKDTFLNSGNVKITRIKTTNIIS